MGQTIFGSNNLKKWKQIYNKQDFRNLLKGIAKWCRQSNWFPGAMGCCFFQFFHLTPIVHDNKLNFFTLNQANVQWYMTTTNSVFQQKNCSIIFLKLTLYPPHLSPVFPQFQTWVLWNMTKFIHYWIFSWSEIEVDQFAAYTYISDSADISETEGVLWDGLLRDAMLKADPGVDVFRNVAELVGESFVIIACGCLEEGKYLHK